MLQLQVTTPAPVEESPRISAPTNADRLASAHERVRFALAEVAAAGTLDVQTADDIARALVASLRDIEAVQTAVTRRTMEAEVRHHG